MWKLIVCLSAFSFSCVVAPEHDLKPGWYSRADSEAIGNGITAWNMTSGETGVRCMCADGFRVTDDTADTFIVTFAPEGYSDTVGRRFKTKPPAPSSSVATNEPVCALLVAGGICIKPDGNISIPEGADITDSSRKFWIELAKVYRKLKNEQCI